MAKAGRYCTGQVATPGFVCRGSMDRCCCVSIAAWSHIDIVCEYGLTDENRGPQHVRAYISLQRA